MSLHCDLYIFHVFCPFLCRIYCGVHISDKCKEDTKGLPVLLLYRFLDPSCRGSITLSLPDTGSERTRAHAA